MKFTAVVPIKTDNNSIKSNFALLNQKPLFHYIFETLLENPLIDEVVCYTHNLIIKDFLPKQVKFVQRASELDNDEVHLNDMLEAISKDIDSDYYVLCSVTSPFISNTAILLGIESILNGEYDSAFSVKKIEAFAWFFNKPLNFHIDNVLKTTEIEPLYIETKGFYIFSRELILSKKYIGHKPFKVEIGTREAINIKTMEDLEFVKLIALNQSTKNNQYFLVSKECHHIIFDMDGVLINSISLMQKAWEFSGGSEYASFDNYKKYIGIPFYQICLKIGVYENKISQIKKRYFAFCEEHIDEIKLYDGVGYTLKKLKENNIKLSIVTSKDYKSAKNIIEHFGLEIDCLIAPDSLFYKGRNKPFGDPLLFSCVVTQTSLEKSVFIGDMLSDYQAAKNANIDFIFASYGYGRINMSVNSIKSIKEILLLIS